MQTDRSVPRTQGHTNLRPRTSLLTGKQHQQSLQKTIKTGTTKCRDGWPIVAIANHQPARHTRPATGADSLRAMRWPRLLKARLAAKVMLPVDRRPERPRTIEGFSCNRLKVLWASKVLTCNTQSKTTYLATNVSQLTLYLIPMPLVIYGGWLKSESIPSSHGCSRSC